LSLLVVVVNYRTADLAVDCLRTLRPEVEGRAGVRVAVVDNASGDGSADRLRGAIAANGWGGWATLLPLVENRGFAAGNNAAIRPALASADPPRFVWMLNPDTLVRPGAVAAVLTFGEARPEVGLFGTRVENPDGSVQSSWFAFPSPLVEFEQMVRLRAVTRLMGRRARSLEPPPVPGPVDWVSGASLVIRREVFDAVGPLDERYFMYFEEVDFCLRAARAGWPCWYVPTACVAHLAGQSSGVSNPNEPRRRRPPYWFAARRRYFLTNHGRVKTVLADLAWTSAFLIYRLRLGLKRRPDIEPRGMFWDFVRYNFLMVRP
jgi:GT2 family glycosyltransferase